MRVGCVVALLALFAVACSGMQWCGSVELVDELHSASADLVLLESHQAIDADSLPIACPASARAAISVCTRLMATLQDEGGVRPGLGFGEEVCAISRFALDDALLCSKVYEHLAEVDQRWNLDARIQSTAASTLCIHALAEPVNSRAILTPRTERKCLGTNTAADTKADMEPEAPKGYTGNTLEDPFGSDINYTEGNCRCECPRGKAPCKGCPCSKGAAAAPAAPAVAVQPAQAKISELKAKVAAPAAPFRPQTPLAPFKPPSPAKCVKGGFLYEFPYSRYLPQHDDVHAVVDVELQRMRVYSGERMLAEYEVSTSQVGIGSEIGSLRTPSGAFRISQKVGDGVPLGIDLVNLQPTGRSSGPNDRAAIQTRALVLDGLDSANRNTRSRLIYVSGTNKVATLGRPASQGGIRLRNADVVALYNSVAVGSRVFVVPRCAWPKESQPNAIAAAVAAAGVAPPKPAVQPAAPIKAAVMPAVQPAAAPKPCKGLGCLLDKVKGMLREQSPRPVQPAPAQPSAQILPQHKKRTVGVTTIQAQIKLAA